MANLSSKEKDMRKSGKAKANKRPGEKLKLKHQKADRARRKKK